MMISLTFPSQTMLQLHVHQLLLTTCYSPEYFQLLAMLLLFKIISILCFNVFMIQDTRMQE